MNGSKCTAALRLMAMVLALCMVCLPLQAQAAEAEVTKQDISRADITGGLNCFQGTPLSPNINVHLDGNLLTEGEDYIVLAENNVNMGTASYCVVGIGNYYGYIIGEFEISNVSRKQYTLNGAYNGNASGELNDQVYYREILHTPGIFTCQLDTTINHRTQSVYGYYELYLVDGEEIFLVATKETEYGYGIKTEFTYDFSNVYEDFAEEGGAVYILAYSWVDRSADIYSGVCVLYIPAKVPDATFMVVEELEDDGDFRREYLTAYGLDGNVGDVEWTSSDSSVAAVKDGVVTLKKPGTVTITGQYGGLTASQVIQVTQQDLAQGEILHYDAQTGKADVFYDGYLLTAGTDYLLSASVQEGVTEVTVTGIGLFGGQLVRQFDAASGEALDHSHSFDSCEDTTCGTCGFERPAAHLYGEQWTKNETHHWHGCVACGNQADLGQHVFSAGDEKVCDICGPLYVAGDLNGDETVDEDDAIYLLQHVLLPDFFPIAQKADYTGDNRLDEDDAIYLLQHVLLPDFFPL